jgi:hypothetical protein
VDVPHLTSSLDDSPVDLFHLPNDLFHLGSKPSFLRYPTVSVLSGDEPDWFVHSNTIIVYSGICSGKTFFQESNHQYGNIFCDTDNDSILYGITLTNRPYVARQWFNMGGAVLYVMSSTDVWISRVCERFNINIPRSIQSDRGLGTGPSFKDYYVEPYHLWTRSKDLYGASTFRRISFPSFQSEVDWDVAPILTRQYHRSKILQFIDWENDARRMSCGQVLNDDSLLSDVLTVSVVPKGFHLQVQLRMRSS